MGFSIGKFFGKTGASAVTGIMKEIDNLSTSAEERNTQKLKVVDAVVNAQVRIIEADARSKGIAAQWRPCAAISFVILVWWYALTPALQLPPPDLTQVPTELWAFLFGYGTYREAGKMVDKFQSKKMLKLAAKIAGMKE